MKRVADLPDPKLDDDVKAAFDMAYDNIHKFHAAQKELADVDVETMPGVRCRRVSRPIGAVGLYVPGGTAVLPSTALMLAAPAKIAGCEHGGARHPSPRTARWCPRCCTSPRRRA